MHDPRPNLRLVVPLPKPSDAPELPQRPEECSLTCQLEVLISDCSKLTAALRASEHTRTYSPSTLSILVSIIARAENLRINFQLLGTKDSAKEMGDFLLECKRTTDLKEPAEVTYQFSRNAEKLRVLFAKIIGEGHV